MDRLDSVRTAVSNAAAGAIVGEELAQKVAALTATIRIEQEGKPFRIKPDGTIETVERLLGQPVFRRGAVEVYEALSFVGFVKRFASAQTIIFADQIERSFTAVFDYHPTGDQQTGAQWDLFRAELPLRLTPAWESWIAVNKQPMAQDAFAQFLEDNIPNIADPSGATLVEIARTLEAKTDVQFESHIRADNGSHRFNYIENVSGTSQGNIVIPQEFTLVLQPFEGSKQYEVKARFRYRITSKKLTLWFDLVRIEDVLREAFDDELLKISSGLGDTIPVYKGPAPDAQKPSE